MLPRPRHVTDEVVAVLPRRSAFVRGDPGDPVTAQVVAANIDVACILHPATKPNPRRLEREVTLVWESGAAPVVVVTKADLAIDAEAAAAALSAAAPGVPLHLVSAPTGRGLDAVRAYAGDNRTLAFIGASGVGKSTLANALLGRDAMTTHEVRDDQRGRHTTTARHLLPLPGGGAILDTPGMRAVAVHDAERGLERAFGDVEAFAGACRFRDCRHEGEPGCAVAEAVRDGLLDAARLASMRALERELEHVRLKQDERARSERRREAQARGRAYRRRERERPKDRWRT